MVPHFVFLPSSLLPLTWYSWSLPTTAKGIISCSTASQVRGNVGPALLHRLGMNVLLATTVSHRSCYKYLSASEREHDPHPDLLVDHSVLGILVKFLLRVHVDAVGSQLFPDLVRGGSNVKPN